MTDVFPSCRWIEGGVVFDEGYLTVCCVNNRRRPIPFICGFDGGKYPVEIVQAKREHIRSANKAAGFPNCVDCGLLETRAWERSDKEELEVVLIHHHKACNLRCRFCFLQNEEDVVDPAEIAQVSPPEDLNATLRSMIEAGHITTNTGVAFAGGEPTLAADFEDTLRLFEDFGSKSIIVFTNSVLLSDSILSRLPHNRALEVVTSVDAGTAETFARIKGVDQFDRVWSNLRTYAGVSDRVAAKMVVMPENLHEVEAFVELAVDCGVRDVRYDVDFWELDVSDEVVASVAQLIDLAELRSLQVSEHGGVMMFGQPLRQRVAKALEKRRQGRRGSR